MRVATWQGGAKFEIERVPDLVPKAGQVVVEVQAVGVCGTDVHITQGLFPATPPQVLGHEGAGTIVSVGEGVCASRLGERVVMDTTSHCGECESCRTWSLSRCERLEKSTGFYAEQALLPASSAHAIPAGMSYEVAALTEPAACCLQGAERVAIAPGSVALVIGGGIMGLLTMAFLKARGVEQIIVSEPLAGRRVAASSLGADMVHDPSGGSLEELVNDVTGGRGVHIAVEAVGKPELVAQCAALARPKGEVLMIGVCPVGAPLPIDLYDFHYKEIRLVGAFGRGNVFADAPEALARLPVEGLVSGNYSLEDVPQAIADAAAGEGVKLIVRPNG